MQESLALSKLAEDIYDTVLDSARWTSVLGKITDFVEGQAGGLLSKDSVSKSGNAYYHVGVDPHYLGLYAESYWRFDPMASLPFCDVPWSWSRIEENSFFWPVSTPFSERSIPAWPTWMKL